MAQPAKPKGRKPTNVTLNADLVQQANALNINMSKAAEDGIHAAIREKLANNWRSENRLAIEQYNADVETTELPFAKFRSF